MQDFRRGFLAVGRTNLTVHPISKAYCAIRLENRSMKTNHILSTLLLMSACASAADLTVVIQNVKKTTGKIYVAVHQESNSKFPGGKAYRQAIASETKEGVTVKFDVEPGIYAVSVFHDENDNQKMDTAMFGIPKEPWAVSNNAKGMMGPPSFEDAKIKVESNGMVAKVRLD
jgi:uncharacterized protein (DUF2141 family)